ncbi:MAG: AbrB/MazE/SpoVT family DNA-binding domain-containing protein [Clostridia bacterium]|nr:AbrB/MazE/SpoVT family DNA-binding domain-containing protein [Clostridia bacterium]
MEADIIKIGNSQGIRLPVTILKQCGIDSKVELEIKDNCIIIKPLKTTRQGWAEAFKLMHKEGDDSLLIPEEIDNEILEDWDE